LDPFNKFTDAVLYAVLEKVSLLQVVNELPLKLNEMVSEGGENFSVGQRQLMCIGRALLRTPNVLMLDEATASIDNETDAKIQSMIRTEFKKCTVLTVAHRLHTIMDSDRVMVLDDGVVLEFDSPSRLLKQKQGAFRGLVEAANNSGSMQKINMNMKLPKL
jgi:ABC-type multidrug transport system fused ATPase/permease subunit